MATQLLSTVDSTFIGGTGTWQTLFFPQSMSSVSSPAPPGGGNSLKTTLTSDPTNQKSIVFRTAPSAYQKPAGTNTSTDWYASVEIALDAGNTGSPVQVRVEVLEYQTPSTAGIAPASSALITVTSAWTTVVLPTFHMLGSTSSWPYVGIHLAFGRGTNPTGGPNVNDSTYIGNVKLLYGPMDVGGWGVGMVRMGLN